MKNVKKLLAVLLMLCLLAAMATVLYACKNSPKSVVKANLKAINDRDAEKMVDMRYPKPMLKVFEEEWNEDKEDLIGNWEKGFEKIEDQFGDDWKVKDIKIKDVRDMEKDDVFEKLQKDYEDDYNVKFTDAKIVTADYTIEGENDVEETKDAEYTVIKYDGKWYIES